MDLLEPTNDYVFKRLLGKGGPILLSMINAVLQPQTPIKKASVLNPEIHPQDILGKNMRLDVLAELDDGTKINLEMQTYLHPGFARRMEFYLSNLHSQGLHIGEPYTRLAVAHAIVWTCRSLFPETSFPGVFATRELRSNRLLSGTRFLHLLELPKTPPLSEDPDSPLLQWAHFLAGSLPARYAKDRGVKLAMNRLKALSKDEKTRRLAQQRSIAARMHFETMCASRDEGREEGRVQGREEGRVQGHEEGRVQGHEEGRVQGHEEGRVQGHEEGRVQGREEGRVQGREEGRELGQAALLLQLLSKKFGELPEYARKKVRSGPSEQLMSWSLRVLEAQSLAEVFDEPS